MPLDTDITFLFIFSAYLTKLLSKRLKLYLKFPNDMSRPSWDNLKLKALNYKNHKQILVKLESKFKNEILKQKLKRFATLWV